MFRLHIYIYCIDFCYIEELNGASRSFCNPSNRQYPCAPGKSYHGRGPLLLSWNYNYGQCGQNLGLDLLRQPELVSSNPIVAFRAAMWFWMKSVRPVLNQGFGSTIRVISSLECNGGNLNAVNARIKYYRDYCGQLGVDAGANVTC
ncbi:Chitinase family protein [Raphanus sativus]|uniref:Endochitinase At2g43580-like n=1 Tax=Raphanus sativus TaxID=3726 RepID=A0A9W3CQ65_RAPSA|nr:endochitinase At2g43580-like [Raphanus sativus]KAJ4871028.1 Chitinase family protein [Raphanus sativus]KAJ4906534.1 Chitinase family protein [Raphanus sativus]